jgi:hypothetical protein
MKIRDVPISVNELVEELGVTGASIRKYLREEHTREPNQWAKMWRLDDKLAEAVRKRFRGPYRAESRLEMVPLTVAIPRDMYRKLGWVATRERRSRNEIVCEALGNWVGSYRG